MLRTVSFLPDLSLSPSTAFATFLQPSDLRSHPPLCQPTLWGKFLMLVRLNKIHYLSAFLHIVPLRTFLYSEVVADLMRRSEITQRGLRSPLPAFPQGDISHAYQGGSKKWTHTNLIHVSPTPHRCNSIAYTVTPHLDEVSKFSVSKFAQTLRDPDSCLHSACNPIWQELNIFGS